MNMEDSPYLRGSVGYNGWEHLVGRVADTVLRLAPRYREDLMVLVEAGVRERIARGPNPPFTEPMDDARTRPRLGPTCERLLVGQGGDTWDPLCVLPEGHAGRCRPAEARPTAADSSQPNPAKPNNQEAVDG